jgi:hypothetical protein
VAGLESTAKDYQRGRRPLSSRWSAQLTPGHPIEHAHDFRTSPVGVVIDERTGASLVVTKHSSPT